ASLLFRKLRKNLGNKNCEFSPEHIAEIVSTYLENQSVERAIDEKGDSVGIAAQVFKNQDFGYYKVNIERPDRRSAQFRADLIEPLRFEKSLREVMEYLYAEHGENVYEAGFVKGIEKEITKWCEENDISLNKAAKTKLLDTKNWIKQRTLVNAAGQLHSKIGDEVYNDFNQFKQL
ncbi:SAM-dependent DNA methyltransferase, partial [Vibrio parahaemolyticus]|nr:SAM-dependent DNA methyltransferase [Vibrio parahaemolyticus]